ncbi:hypothetical protein ACPOL_0978 [Acidisarcina polymorpha]|uniref:Uncharacterized protein n=1 Tax=Acidisarcina polymorpha TaxID=2211140 RepID=A0A2Z5FTZ8_9BACT|nr:hypothetical protein ACPOL_0978 [Acidisarcina polymorpha]
MLFMLLLGPAEEIAHCGFEDRNIAPLLDANFTLSERCLVRCPDLPGRAGITLLRALLNVLAIELGGLSIYTIHAWLSSGKLRRTKVGSRTMIRESELQRVIRDEPRSDARSL